MALWRRALVIFVCLLPMLLCGCGSSLVEDIGNWLDEAKEERAYNNISKTISKDSEYAMSKETKEAQKAVSAAQFKLDNSSIASWKPSTWIDALLKDDVCFPWMKSSQDAKLKAEVTEAYNDYELAKSTDAVYQAQVQDAEAVEKVNRSNKIKQFMPLIILAFVLLILLVLFLVLLKSKGKKPVNVTEVEKPEISDVDRTGQLKVNYNKLLKASCKKAGVDYKLTLNSYGGDARKAYENLNYMVGKGMSSNEIINKMSATDSGN